MDSASPVPRTAARLTKLDVRPPDICASSAGSVLGMEVLLWSCRFMVGPPLLVERSSAEVSETNPGGGEDGVRDESPAPPAKPGGTGEEAGLGTTCAGGGCPCQVVPDESCCR